MTGMVPAERGGGYRIAACQSCPDGASAGFAARLTVSR
jgi:hypothetical protein